MNEITVHGLTFGVDNCDWDHFHADSEIGVEMLHEWLRSLTAEEASSLHAALNKDVIDYANDPAFAALGRAEKAAKDASTEGWAKYPTVGHNMYVYAA
jgi:hypothetical protein